MSKPEHTPTPWKTDPDVEHESVIGPDGNLVADCAIFFAKKNRQKKNQANAEFIVAAVNAHDALHECAAQMAGKLESYIRRQENSNIGITKTFKDADDDLLDDARAVLQAWRELQKEEVSKNERSNPNR